MANAGEGARQVQAAARPKVRLVAFAVMYSPMIYTQKRSVHSSYAIVPDNAALLCTRVWHGVGLRQRPYGSHVTREMPVACEMKAYEQYVARVVEYRPRSRAVHPACSFAGGAVLADVRHW